MNQYDIFKSEGGYRVALNVHNDSPVIDQSPWFETLVAAENFLLSKKFLRIKNKYEVFLQGDSWCSSYDSNGCGIDVDYVWFGTEWEARHHSSDKMRQELLEADIIKFADECN